MDDKKPTQGVITINNKIHDCDFTGQKVVKMTDKGGYTFLLHKFEGVYYPLICSLPVLKKIRGFKMRPDDIYFTAHPRTGTHWTYERMAMLLKGKAETIPKCKEEISIYPESEFSLLPSPRIISSHMFMSQSPTEVLTKRCKVVYSMRDPKDVVVSVYNLMYGRVLEGGEKYLGKFGDFLHLFLKGMVDNNGLFDHWRDAERFFDDHPEIPVYIHIYEESQEDPLKAVQRLSDFLGLHRDNRLCQQIAEKCAFSRMKVDKDDYCIKVDGDRFLLGKGRSGGWREFFTKELLDEYYKVYEEKMAGSRLYHRYSRNATV